MSAGPGIPLHGLVVSSSAALAAAPGAGGTKRPRDAADEEDEPPRLETAGGGEAPRRPIPKKKPKKESAGTVAAPAKAVPAKAPAKAPTGESKKAAAPTGVKDSPISIGADSYPEIPALPIGPSPSFTNAVRFTDDEDVTEIRFAPRIDLIVAKPSFVVRSTVAYDKKTLAKKVGFAAALFHDLDLKNLPFVAAEVAVRAYPAPAGVYYPWSVVRSGPQGVDPSDNKYYTWFVTPSTNEQAVTGLRRGICGWWMTREKRGRTWNWQDANVVFAHVAGVLLLYVDKGYRQPDDETKGWGSLLGQLKKLRDFNVQVADLRYGVLRSIRLLVDDNIAYQNRLNKERVTTVDYERMLDCRAVIQVYRSLGVYLQMAPPGMPLFPRSDAALDHACHMLRVLAQCFLSGSRSSALTPPTRGGRDATRTLLAHALHVMLGNPEEAQMPKALGADPAKWIARRKEWVADQERLVEGINSIYMDIDAYARRETDRRTKLIKEASEAARARAKQWYELCKREAKKFTANATAMLTPANVARAMPLIKDARQQFELEALNKTLVFEQVRQESPPDDQKLLAYPRMLTCKVPGCYDDARFVARCATAEDAKACPYNLKAICKYHRELDSGALETKHVHSWTRVRTKLSNEFGPAHANRWGALARYVMLLYTAHRVQAYGMLHMPPDYIRGAVQARKTTKMKVEPPDSKKEQKAGDTSSSSSAAAETLAKVLPSEAKEEKKEEKEEKEAEKETDTSPPGAGVPSIVSDDDSESDIDEEDDDDEAVVLDSLSFLEKRAKRDTAARRFYAGSTLLIDMELAEAHRNYVACAYHLPELDLVWQVVRRMCQDVSADASIGWGKHFLAGSAAGCVLDIDRKATEKPVWTKTQVTAIVYTLVATLEAVCVSPRVCGIVASPYHRDLVDHFHYSRLFHERLDEWGPKTVYEERKLDLYNPDTIEEDVEECLAELFRSRTHQNTTATAFVLGERYSFGIDKEGKEVIKWRNALLQRSVAACALLQIYRVDAAYLKTLDKELRPFACPSQAARLVELYEKKRLSLLPVDNAVLLPDDKKLVEDKKPNMFREHGYLGLAYTDCIPAGGPGEYKRETKYILDQKQIDTEFELALGAWSRVVAEIVKLRGEDSQEKVEKALRKLETGAKTRHVFWDCLRIVQAVARRIRKEDVRDLTQPATRFARDVALRTQAKGAREVAGRQESSSGEKFSVADAMKGWRPPAYSKAIRDVAKEEGKRASKAIKRVSMQSAEMIEREAKEKAKKQTPKKGESKVVAESAADGESQRSMMDEGEDTSDDSEGGEEDDDDDDDDEDGAEEADPLQPEAGDFDEDAELDELLDTDGIVATSETKKVAKKKQRMAKAAAQLERRRAEARVEPRWQARWVDVDHEALRVAELAYLRAMGAAEQIRDEKQRTDPPPTPAQLHKELAPLRKALLDLYNTFSLHTKMPRTSTAIQLVYIDSARRYNQYLRAQFTHQSPIVDRQLKRIRGDLQPLTCFDMMVWHDVVFPGRPPWDLLLPPQKLPSTPAIVAHLKKGAPLLHTEPIADGDITITAENVLAKDGKEVPLGPRAMHAAAKRAFLVELEATVDIKKSEPYAEFDKLVSQLEAFRKEPNKNNKANKSDYQSLSDEGRGGVIPSPKEWFDYLYGKVLIKQKTVDELRKNPYHLPALEVLKEPGAFQTKQAARQATEEELKLADSLRAQIYSSVVDDYYRARVWAAMTEEQKAAFVSAENEVPEDEPPLDEEKKHSRQNRGDTITLLRLRVLPPPLEELPRKPADAPPASDEPRPMDETGDEKKEDEEKKKPKVVVRRAVPRKSALEIEVDKWEQFRMNRDWYNEYQRNLTVCELPRNRLLVGDAIVDLHTIGCLGVLIESGWLVQSDTPVALQVADEFKGTAAAQPATTTDHHQRVRQLCRLWGGRRLDELSRLRRLVPSIQLYVDQRPRIYADQKTAADAHVQQTRDYSSVLVEIKTRSNDPVFLENATNPDFKAMLEAGVQVVTDMQQRALQHNFQWLVKFVVNEVIGIGHAAEGLALAIPTFERGLLGETRPEENLYPRVDEKPLILQSLTEAGAMLDKTRMDGESLVLPIPLSGPDAIRCSYDAVRARSATISAAIKRLAPPPPPSDAPSPPATEAEVETPADDTIAGGMMLAGFGTEEDEEKKRPRTSPTYVPMEFVASLAGIVAHWATGNRSIPAAEHSLAYTHLRDALRLDMPMVLSKREEDDTRQRAIIEKSDKVLRTPTLLMLDAEKARELKELRAKEEKKQKELAKKKKREAKKKARLAKADSKEEKKEEKEEEEEEKDESEKEMDWITATVTRYPVFDSYAHMLAHLTHFNRLLATDPAIEWDDGFEAFLATLPDANMREFGPFLVPWDVPPMGDEKLWREERPAVRLVELSFKAAIYIEFIRLRYAWEFHARVLLGNHNANSVLLTSEDAKLYRASVYLRTSVERVRRTASDAPRSLHRLMWHARVADVALVSINPVVARYSATEMQTALLLCTSSLFRWFGVREAKSPYNSKELRDGMCGIGAFGDLFKLETDMIERLDWTEYDATEYGGHYTEHEWREQIDVTTARELKKLLRFADIVKDALTETGADDAQLALDASRRAVVQLAALRSYAERVLAQQLDFVEMLKKRRTKLQQANRLRVFERLLDSVLKDPLGDAHAAARVLTGQPPGSVAPIPASGRAWSLLWAEAVRFADKLNHLSREEADESLQLWPSREDRKKKKQKSVLAGYTRLPWPSDKLRTLPVPLTQTPEFVEMMGGKWTGVVCALHEHVRYYGATARGMQSVVYCAGFDSYIPAQQPPPSYFQAPKQKKKAQHTTATEASAGASEASTVDAPALPDEKQAEISAELEARVIDEHLRTISDKRLVPLALTEEAIKELRGLFVAELRRQEHNVVVYVAIVGSKDEKLAVGHLNAFNAKVFAQLDADTEEEDNKVAMATLAAQETEAEKESADHLVRLLRGRLPIPWCVRETYTSPAPAFFPKPEAARLRIRRAVREWRQGFCTYAHLCATIRATMLWVESHMTGDTRFRLTVRSVVDDPDFYDTKETCEPPAADFLPPRTRSEEKSQTATTLGLAAPAAVVVDEDEKEEDAKMAADIDAYVAAHAKRRQQ
jgi:hypothetical protein